MDGAAVALPAELVGVDVEVTSVVLTMTDEESVTITKDDVSMTLPLLVTLTEVTSVVVEGATDIDCVEVCWLPDPDPDPDPVDRLTDCLFSSAMASSILPAREVIASAAIKKEEMNRYMVAGVAVKLLRHRSKFGSR